MFSKILLSFVLTTSAFASYERAEKNYGKGTISLSGYRTTIIELVNGGYHFSAIPWMKDFLVKNRSTIDKDLEYAFDEIITVAGVKPFESLPVNILARSKSGNIQYILAKRHFQKNENKSALSLLEKISSDHPAYPFVANMKGAVHANLGNTSEAMIQFKDCIRFSERNQSRAKSPSKVKQLEINADYCRAGLARSAYGGKDFKQAELFYLDIQKESFVWPDILLEEAWTSYYIKNYNRTLGKLVSYKAPVFDFIFKPEIEVLKALTYLKMCLYDDARSTADQFQDELFNKSKELRSFLNSRGKNYKYFYNLIADFESGKKLPISILDPLMKSISKEGAYMEMKAALSDAIREYNGLRKKQRSGFRNNLMTNIKAVLDDYRTTIGSYVRASLVSKYAELYDAFEGMSYIKLEILAQKKEKLYQAATPSENKKRGDVKNIDRNDKQYFWNFNGEFWADELGDYVFALRSEC